MGYSAKEGMNRYRRARAARERLLLKRWEQRTSHEHVPVQVTMPAAEGGRGGLTALDEIPEIRCRICKSFMGFPV